MSMTFLEYCAAMIGCYSALPKIEQDELHAWESSHVDGSGNFGTSDWPGWEKYIGKFEPPRKQEAVTFGYVYLVRSGTGHCKIGSSKNVATRIRQLQCANPENLVLLHQFPSVNAKEDELGLHKKFAQKRIRNEWFALTYEDIESICGIHT
jgi:hypothetical protein